MLTRVTWGGQCECVWSRSQVRDWRGSGWWSQSSAHKTQAVSWPLIGHSGRLCPLIGQHGPMFRVRCEAIMERKLRAAWSSPGHLHHPGNNSVPGSHHRNLLPPRAITEELKAITILCVNFSGNKKTISPVISVSFVKRERERRHLGEFSLPLSFVIRGSVRFLCPRNVFIVLISRAARARAPGDIIAMQCCAQMLSYKKLHYNDPLVMIKVNDSNKRQKEVEWSLNCTRVLSLGSRL